jgi:hypothetical protein
MILISAFIKMGGKNLAKNEAIPARQKKGSLTGKKRSGLGVPGMTGWGRRRFLQKIPKTVF